MFNKYADRRITKTQGNRATAKTRKAEILSEDHYYPFGMRMSGQHFVNTDILNKYLYNGKELQDQTGYLDYGFRQLDVSLGRWFVVDLLAENFYRESPYSYAGNNPIAVKLRVHTSHFKTVTRCLDAKLPVRGEF